MLELGKSVSREGGGGVLSGDEDGENENIGVVKRRMESRKGE